MQFIFSDLPTAISIIQFDEVFCLMQFLLLDLRQFSLLDLAQFLFLNLTQFLFLDLAQFLFLEILDLVQILWNFYYSI